MKKNIPASLRRDNAKEAITRLLLHDLVLENRRDDNVRRNERNRR